MSMEKPVVEAVSTSNPYVISRTSEAQINCHRLPAFTETNFSYYLKESPLYLKKQITNSVKEYFFDKNINVSRLIDRVVEENECAGNVEAYKKMIMDAVTDAINQMLDETKLPPPTSHFTTAP
jgi:hypothetical protein